MSNSKVYNVVLSTMYNAAEPFGNLIKPISVSNLANASWIVNWDGLFGQDLLLYKRCRLRYELISNANGSLTATANTGFLALTGVSTDKQASNIPGAFLGLITIDVAPGTSVFRFYKSNLSEIHGIEVNLPRGLSEVGIRFYNDDAITFQTGVVDYIVQLQFELFNE